MPDDVKTRWASAAWRAEAEAWIDAALAAVGRRRTAPLEQPRIRFWSTQLVVETADGRVWFKENNPGQLFEAELVAVLATLDRDHVVAPIAVEPARGWLLNADQGPTLAALPGTDEPLWTRLVQDFARLQRTVEGHGDALVDAGLPALRPTDEVAAVEAALEECRSFPDGHPRAVDEEFASKVRAVLPRVAAHAHRLDAGPVALSLDHNDLHHNNVFQARADEPLRFFDFGDALWSHPFCSMRIVFNVLWHEWQGGDDDPRLARILDAYLEAWTDVATRAELRELMRSALAIGLVHRVASWQRVLPFADDDDLTEFGDAPAAWMRMLLKPDLTPWG